MLETLVIFEENDEITAVIPNVYSEDIHMKFNDMQYNIANVDLFPEIPNNISLNIAFALEGEIIKTENGKIICKYTHFVDIIAQKLNASINYIHIAKDTKTQKEYAERLNGEIELRLNELDLSIIPGHVLFFNGVVNMYETRHFCLIAPLPPSIAIFDQILFRPFDEKVWKYLCISVAFSALIWRLFKNYGANSSVTGFLFGLFAFFVGQSAKFQV